MEMSYIAKSRAISKIIIVTSNPTLEDYDRAAAEFDNLGVKLPIVSQVPAAYHPNLLLESMDFHQVLIKPLLTKPPLLILYDLVEVKVRY